MKYWLTLTTSLLLLFSSGCGEKRVKSESTEKVLRTSAGGRINTLDPALSADLVSQYMVAAFYDTLLQYDYTKRPYTLIPSMLESMPEISDDQKHYRFKLRGDLYFQDDPCFRGKSKEKRRITATDVVFSLLRIADARLHSPGFWLFRHKVEGIDRFREITSYTRAENFSPYDQGCKGFEVLNNLEFAIHLTKPDPRLLYALAMPYAGVVSRQAVEFYGEDFSEHPVGSGPFKLREWWRNFRIVLERNPDYRQEFFPKAQNPADRQRPLPLLDKIVCYLVKQPLASWLLFLQGELDMTSLDKENFQLVVDDNLELVPALKRRGVKLYQIPSFQVNYVGFNFADPILADNPNLRKAISCAYDIEKRLKHFNYRVVPANGPIPPGVAGYAPEQTCPYRGPDLEKAREYMKKAGYPDGVDPQTGEKLALTFDQSGNSAQHRQLAELMVEDMRLIGIEIKPVLNNKPRFFQKLRGGKLQLFRISWVGDYPDAENFLQLFYGPNAGSCNRAFYRDSSFDKLYEDVVAMRDNPARTKKYAAMAKYIVEQCPWIFESYPIDYRLTQSWLTNYIPHDFAFARWKYLSVDPVARESAIKNFKPLSMNELRRPETASAKKRLQR